MLRRTTDESSRCEGGWAPVACKQPRKTGKLGDSCETGRRIRNPEGLPASIKTAEQERSLWTGGPVEGERRALEAVWRWC